MLRNLSRTILMAAAAWFAATSALSAQQPGTDPLRGDVDGDAAVPAADARIVADYLVGKPVPSGANVRDRGDVNGDGRITSVDAAIIRGFVAGRANVGRFKVGAPVGELPANTMATVVCQADVRSSTVKCGDPATPGGLRATEMNIGGQGVNVRLTSSNVNSVLQPDNSRDFTFDVTVENLLPQRLGTTEDGVTPHPKGVRVFFDQSPTATGPTGGEIDVLDAQSDLFLGGQRDYYSYAAPLEPGDTSAAVQWHFKLSPSVANFQFTVYVWAHGLPGWIDITPPAHDPSPYEVPVNYLAPGGSVELKGTVRNSFGVRIGQPVNTWSSSFPDSATVTKTSDSTATVNAGTAEGVTIVTASSQPAASVSSNARIGRTKIVVTYGDSAASTITANPLSVPVGGNSTVTLQAKFPNGVNVPVGGGTVTLTASPGGALTVVDNNNGTYTANLTSNTAGTVTVSGTINGRPLDNTATVDFTAGVLDHFKVEAAAGGAIPNQLVNASFNVKVTAQDAFNNTVPGYTGMVQFTTTPVNKVSAGGTSPAFVAGVLSSHAVTIDSTGTYSLVATDTEVNTITGASTPPFQVEAAPTAVADGPLAGSSPGGAYHLFYQTARTIPADSGLMANDTRGFPLATVVSFGGGTMGGTVTSNTANGTPVVLSGPNGGSLAVNPDGSLTFDPPDNFTGLFTFQYRISNVRGTSDAQVTIAVGVPPSARDTTYTPALLGNVPINTALGTPFAAPIAGDNKVITIVTEVGGDATLADDGTFTFTPAAGHTGPASFSYTVGNGFETTPARTVSMTVTGIAWFVDANAASNGDGRLGSPFNNLSAAFAAATKPLANQPIFLYASGNSYTGVTLLAGQTLVGQGASGSFATAMGVTWPTHAVSAAPTLNNTPSTVSVASGLTLGTNNTLRGFTSTGTIAGPGPSGFGTLTVSEVAINNTGGTALSLNNGTLAGSFSSVQSGGGTNNVSLTNVATSGTATLGTDGDALSGATGNAVAISGGNGSFTFPGNISNGGISVSGKNGGTVSFTGTKNISSAAAAGVSLSNNAGATISFTGGALTVATTTGTGFLANGGGTVEVTGAGNTVTVSGAAARAVELNGIIIPAGGISFSSIQSNGTTTGTAFLASGVTNTGGGFTAGSITVAGTTGGVASRGIDVTSSSAPFTFTTASVNGTSGQGIFLSNNTAAVAVNGGSVGNSTSTTGDALSITNGNAAVTVAATLTKSTAGRIANITGRTGGTTTVSGTLSCTGTCTGINAGSNTGGTIDFSAATKTLNTGANAAVTLASNGSGTVNFSNGGLVIQTTSGAGFNATTSGTVTVTTGVNPNTISTGSGTALSVTDVTIGSDDLTFRSITAGTSGNPANGIVLSNTGALGGLTVTGNGTAGSGGTIQNTTGSDGSVGGNGIYLSSTRDVSLAFMQINDHPNNGLRGSNVTGLTLNKVRFTGANGNNLSAPFIESAVFIEQLTGSASITGSFFSGGMSNNFRLTNTSGVLNRITFTSDTFAVQSGNPTTRLLNDAVLVQGLVTATVNATIQNSTFQAAGGDLLQYDLGGSGTGDLVLNQNAFSNNHSNIASGGGGVVLSAGGGGSSTFTYAVTNNTFRDASGTALVVSKTSGTGTATGSITGNLIGVAGVAHSGSAQGSGIDLGQVGGGTHTSTITGNTIRQFTNPAGILMQVGNNSAANGGQGRLKVVIQSNLITELSPTVASAFIATNGIHLQTGLLAGDNVIACATIGGAGALANTVNGSGANGGTDIRLRALQSSVIALPGFVGATAADRATFLTNNNQSGETASAVTGGSGSYTGTCPF